MPTKKARRPCGPETLTFSLAYKLESCWTCTLVVRPACVDQFFCNDTNSSYRLHANRKRFELTFAVIFLPLREKTGYYSSSDLGWCTINFSTHQRAWLFSNASQMQSFLQLMTWFEMVFGSFFVCFVAEEDQQIVGLAGYHVIRLGRKTMHLEFDRTRRSQRERYWICLVQTIYSLCSFTASSSVEWAVLDRLLISWANSAVLSDWRTTNGWTCNFIINQYLMRIFKFGERQ